MLKKIDCTQITIAQTCSSARGKSLENDYDLIVINSPVDNEIGETFAIQAVTRGTSQVLILLDHEIHSYITNIVQEHGIATLPKPLDPALLQTTLSLIKSVNKKLQKYQSENAKLKRQLEDIKLVDRAKFILISHLNMSETESHKYIERQAMNTRTPRRTIAENILKTYDN